MLKTSGKLQTATFVRLMFLYKHLPITTDASPGGGGGGVKLYCRCFTQLSTLTEPVYTKYFQTEEAFHEFISSPRLIKATKTFNLVPNTLTLWNPIGKKLVNNRMLVTSQTNICSLLNKSFTKCSSDPLKWFIFTSARLVSGDPTQQPHVFTNITAILHEYHHETLKPGSSNESEDGLPAEGGDRHDVFSVYDTWFGGTDRLLHASCLANEYVTGARGVITRLEGIYKDYNSNSDIVSCTSVSYANLRFFEDLSERFKTVWDVLGSCQDTAEQDRKYVDKYQQEVRTVTDRGFDHIKSFLKSTIRHEPYDPSAHVGYTFDDPTAPTSGTHGHTPPQSCGDFSKEILKKNLFPNSMFKCIRGTSVHTIAALCNSDSKMLMSGDKVKDALRNKYGITTDVAVMAVSAGKQGYRYCKLNKPDALNSGYWSNKPLLKAILAHTSKPSMDSYNKYINEVRRGCPKLMLNELIVPKKAVFVLSLDVDDKELVNVFYSKESTATWAVRAETVRLMTTLMEDFLNIIDPLDGGENGHNVSCSGYESIPDSMNDMRKVGLRLVYKFPRLLFKDTEVVNNFIRAFKYFVFRKAPSIGNSIDEAIYQPNTCHLLRLPMMGKAALANGAMSRQLMPIITTRNKSFLPTTALVHAKHSSLDEANARVITEIGNINSLVEIYSPRDAEFNLLKKRGRRRRIKIPWWMSSDATEGGSREEDDDHAASTQPIVNHSQYFLSILDSIIMPAIQRRGGGDRTARLQTVKINLSNQYTSYTLAPMIRWCVHRQHVLVSGNPCRYFITIGQNGTFRVNMSCFGCGVHSDIYTGTLPDT